ncbi:MAG: hypothetical protein AAF850_10565 [Pseudomonadota bacterium]
MAIFRFVAWLFVALAIALLGADAISSLESGTPTVRMTSDILGVLGVSDALALAASAPDGVSDALTTLLTVPLWAIFGLIGIVLTLVFRPID